LFRKVLRRFAHNAAIEKKGLRSGLEKLSFQDLTPNLCVKR